MVTISIDNLFETNEFRASVGARWTFLSDAGRKVQKDLDIQEYTAPGRPSTEDLRRDHREAAREIRPDWDLPAPGFRENRDDGDRSMHYPYGDSEGGHG